LKGRAQMVALMLLPATTRPMFSGRARPFTVGEGSATTPQSRSVPRLVNQRLGLSTDEDSGSVALILAVVALQLARLGRDRLSDFADELDWALVETNHRALWVWLFRIEIEDILHPGDVFGIKPGNAPHVLTPGFEVVFGQAPAHGFLGDVGMRGELDQLTGQQLQGPMGPARGWFGTGGRDQQGFVLA
jgi:hypothetical protein